MTEPSASSLAFLARGPGGLGPSRVEPVERPLRRLVERVARDRQATPRAGLGEASVPSSVPKDVSPAIPYGPWASRASRGRSKSQLPRSPMIRFDQPIVGWGPRDFGRPWLRAL